MGRDPVKTLIFIKVPVHQTVYHYCVLQRTFVFYLFHLILFYSERCEFLLFFFFFFLRENAKAKRCLKNLIDFDCNFPALAKEALELAYSDYNPFCANNRDPGATGNDQCDGVQDKSGDALKYFNAAAGIKSGVLQTLMFASFFLLLFFKVQKALAPGLS